MAMSNSEIHYVKATSFADPADLAAFNRAKAKGLTDEQAFSYGDNCIGKWDSHPTGEGSGPICALPRDDWQHLSSPGGTKVKVCANGREVICELWDTAPWKRNIHNVAGGNMIDLNPDACKTLGLRPPVMCAATWQFV